jgi:zinc-ribbon domain
MPFCEVCGKQISDVAKFCPHCGAPVTDLQRNTAPVSYHTGEGSAYADFFAKNGIQVRIGIERRVPSGVFGRDFVSGGLKDFFEQYQSGYWIIAKCDLRRSNLPALMRPVVLNALGPGAVVMPETAASHLTTVLWTGDNVRDPGEILRAMVGLVQAEVLTGDRPAAKASVAVEEEPQKTAEQSEEERREAAATQDRVEKRTVYKHYHIALPARGTYRVSEEELPAETRRIAERMVKEGFLVKREEVKGGQLWAKKVTHYELTDKGKQEWRDLMV